VSRKKIPSDRLLGDKLRRNLASSLAKYEMIEPGDKILLAVSGGKDSLSMVKLFADAKRRFPFSFRLDAVTVDGGFDRFDFDAVGSFCAGCGVDYKALRDPIFKIIKENSAPGNIPCVMCARMRRGVLYSYAAENGYGKIALGHHREDSLETLMMNVFFNARIAAMPPKLISDDGRNAVIRPLCDAPEAWIARYAEINRLPVQKPLCPLAKDGKEEDGKRVYVRRLLDSLDAEFPDAVANAHASLRRVSLRHLPPQEKKRAPQED